MATLVGVALLAPPTSAGPPLRAQLVLPALTDNRGNALALARLATVRFPLTLVACELSAQLEARGMRLALEWAPREFNSEADSFSNGDTTGFDPRLRQQLDPATHPWLVLGALRRQAEEFYAARGDERLQVVGRQRKRRTQARGSRDQPLGTW